MKTTLCIGLIFSLGVSSAEASCLSEVSAFAKDICGEIDGAGTQTVVDANGNVDASVSNIIRRVVGGGSATVNGQILYDTYTGVVRDQLGSAKFNVLDCRQKMVNVAVAQVCQPTPPSPPPVVLKSYILCEGEFEGNCPPHDSFTPCASYKNWANAMCNGHFNEQHISSVDGNRCGYGIFKITCQ
jgi:hypothetical protein